MQNSGSALPDFNKEIEGQESRPRLKFWETDDLFSCPIAGICLTVAEQRQLLKKAGVSMKKASLFEMHEILVASAKNENTLSRKIDSLLHRKFSKKSQRFASMTEDELAREWREAFDAGDYISIFWYLAFNPDLSRDFKREIFGDIHMSMHRDSSERADIIGRMENLKEQGKRFSDKASDEESRRKTVQRELSALKREMKVLEDRLAASEKARKSAEDTVKEIKRSSSHADIGELEAEIEFLELKNGGLADENISLIGRVKELEARNRKLEGDLFIKGEAEAHFQKEIEEMMAESCGGQSCDRSCPSFDLCRKRVLIVGGISRMESLYRKVVESNGGIFEYHDGHVKGGLGKLERSFRRADLVLCPVNCNSHAACILVKQLGKKHNKPVQMLSGSGLSAISQGIRLQDDYGESSPVRGIKHI